MTTLSQSLLQLAEKGLDLPAQLTHTGRGKFGIFDHIQVFYNRKRRHSALGYLSPEEFENINQQAG